MWCWRCGCGVDGALELLELRLPVDAEVLAAWRGSYFGLHLERLEARLVMFSSD